MEADTRTLTTDVDQGAAFTGTADDDVFVSQPKSVIDPSDGTASFTDTLQSLDELDGGEGNDTLNVTLATVVGVEPVLTSIENVNVQFKAAETLDLVNATGVEVVTVQNSTAAGSTALVDNVAGADLAVKSQNQNANFDNSTATTLNLELDSVGVVPVKNQNQIVVDIATNAAETVNLTVNDANAEITSLTTAAETLNIAASGENIINLSDDVVVDLAVTGAGSVDLSDTAQTSLETLTAGDGGVTVDATGGVLEEVSTGAGEDDITVVGANVKSIETGAGDDEVATVTSALAATSVVDLGAGDDYVSLSAAPTAGATVAGGEGVDTIALAQAAYTTVEGYTSEQRAKLSGFEIAAFTDSLANGTTYSLGALEGITSAKLENGVATGGTATLSNIGVDASIELAGDLDNLDGDNGTTVDPTGALVGTLAVDTNADSVSLKLNSDYADNNNTTSVEKAVATSVTLAQVENITVEATGNDTAAPYTPVEGYKADTVAYTVTLDGSNDLETLTITGDQLASFTSTADMKSLATVNAAQNTGGVAIDVSAAATDGTAEPITITGSSAADEVTGSGNSDTISVGAGNDVVNSSAGADSITFGEGIDTYVLANVSHSTLAKTDTIVGFNPNTIGQGTSGAANEDGADNSDLSDETLVNGDLIDLTAGTPTKIEFLTVNNSSDAQTFLQNAAADTDIAAQNVAFDSSTSRLYIDADNDGTADSVIELQGVTEIDEAAFVVA